MNASWPYDRPAPARPDRQPLPIFRRAATYLAFPLHPQARPVELALPQLPAHFLQSERLAGSCDSLGNDAHADPLADFQDGLGVADARVELDEIDRQPLQL